MADSGCLEVAECLGFRTPLAGAVDVWCPRVCERLQIHLHLDGITLTPTYLVPRRRVTLDRRSDAGRQ